VISVTNADFATFDGLRLTLFVYVSCNPIEADHSDGRVSPVVPSASRAEVEPGVEEIGPVDPGVSGT
jgi:hypothetical protein